MDSEIDRQAGRQTVTQTDTGRQTDSEIDRQKGRQTDGDINMQTESDRQ